MPSAVLIYLYQRSYSASFYSQGTARRLDEPQDVLALFDNAALEFIAVPNGKLTALPPWLRARLEVVAEFPRYTLYTELEKMKLKPIGILSQSMNY